MPRTKNPSSSAPPRKKKAVAKGKKGQTSTSRGEGSERRPEKRPRESSPPPPPKSQGQINWERKVDKKSFVVERRVDVGKVGNGECFGAIITSKLEFMDTAYNGYIPNFVRQFYKTMEYDDDGLGEQITATVKGTKVRMDKFKIAQTLGYTPVEREKITYPRARGVAVDIPFEQLVLRTEAVAGGSTSLGNLNAEAGLLNKIMHYNIFPRGDEKMLGKREMELLWVLWSTNEGMNIAEFIFNQIRRYPEESTAKAALPYPCLITKLCSTQNVEQGPNDRLLQDRGAITLRTMAKAKSQKRDTPAAAAQPPASMPKQLKGASFQTYVKDLFRWIGCKMDDCLEGQKAIKRELDKQKPRQEYLMKWAASQGAEPYASPPREPEAGPSQQKQTLDIVLVKEKGPEKGKGPAEEEEEGDEEEEEEGDDGGEKEESGDSTEELVSE